MIARARGLSVVIPAFNAALYLGEAIASVLAEVDDRLEIIVVDDSSSDETAAIAQAHAGSGVSCIRRGRQGGAGAARNEGVAAARGPYLAFLDADDRWPAGRLRRLFAALHDAPAPDMAFGHMRHFLAAGVSPGMAARASNPPLPGYCAGAMLIRLADFRRVGMFEEDLKLGEFIGWFARACDLGLTSALVEDVVLERRIHGANLTIRRRADYGDYAQVLKRALDRRRRGVSDP